MNNEQNANQPLFPIATNAISRLKALDERVAKLGQETLDKDQMIELLSNENKKLKEELAEEKEMTQELRDVNDDLMLQNEGLIEEIDQLTIQMSSSPFYSAAKERTDG